jgi:hypothetical protein
LADYSYDFVKNEAMEKAKEEYYSGDSIPDFIEKLPH